MRAFLLIPILLSSCCLSAGVEGTTSGAGGSSTAGGSGGGSSTGGTTGGSCPGPTDGGLWPSCDADGGCCPGYYCWGFSHICLQNGSCQGQPPDFDAGILCSCDGFPAQSCPAGQVCPGSSHGQTYHCVDAG